MTEKNSSRLLMDVIALPPLKMVLVHAKNETVNQSSSISALRDASEFTEEKVQEEVVQSESVKKLIQHLEKKIK